MNEMQWLFWNYGWNTGWEKPMMKVPLYWKIAYKTNNNTI
jgi:hypothetical protein